MDKELRGVKQEPAIPIWVILSLSTEADKCHLKMAAEDKPVEIGRRKAYKMVWDGLKDGHHVQCDETDGNRGHIFACFHKKDVDRLYEKR